MSSSENGSVPNASGLSVQGRKGKAVKSKKSTSNGSISSTNSPVPKKLNSSVLSSKGGDQGSAPQVSTISLSLTCHISTFY